MQYENKKIVDFHGLGLSKRMINNINYINGECNTFIKHKDTMIENIVLLLGNYVEIIIKDGINVTRQKIKINKINDLDDRYNSLIELYKYTNMDILINSINNRKSTIDILNLIIFYCIKLYKHAQLFEFKLNNFNDINLLAQDNCCGLCITKSKFNNSLDELMDDIHPFCKDSYDVNIKEKDINAFLDKLKIMIPQYIKDIDIKILNKIDFDLMDEINEEQKEKINSINESVISYCNNTKLLINKHQCKDIYHTLLLNVFKFELEDSIVDWFKDKYNKKIKDKNVVNDIVIYKSPFISFISEIDHINYLKESIVYYIIDKEKLQRIDNEVFEYVKENIFNNLEFR